MPAFEDVGTTYLIAETIVGRTMWLSHIRQMVDINVKILQEHQWHIIQAAPNIEWPTSDDPVICLSYRSENDCNFEGGIAQKNAEILFPLSPKHLLYTHVGNKHSVDRFQKNEWFSKLVRIFILEHGFLHIYRKVINKECSRTAHDCRCGRI